MTSHPLKRIAKNTFILHTRMLLATLVSLFTVRIVLNALGVVDYGLFAVVSAMVMLFTFLTSSMAVASERFFAFEIGNKDPVRLKNIFSLSVVIYILLAVALLFIAETIGLWFIHHRLVIPPERLEAAGWVYQLSVFSFLLNLLITPYHAAMIAHEDMGAYAYIGIFDVFFKLVSLVWLVASSLDKLILYAFLMFATTCVSSCWYIVFCRRKYAECTFRPYWNAALFKTLIGYVGWNLIGNLSMVLKNQGVNIVLNMFFGPAINAARSIAYQVGAAVTSFADNVAVAVRPQIIKSYASKDQHYMMGLFFKSAKFSYYLTLIVCLPILLETYYVLALWLNHPPEYTVIFTRLVLIEALINAFNASIFASIQARGSLSFYQIIIGGIQLVNLPAAYLALMSGYPPESTLVVSIAISAVAVILRLIILNKLLHIPLRRFAAEVLVPVLLISCIAFFVPLGFMLQMNEGFIRFITISCSSVFLTMVSIYVFGMTRNEKTFLLELLFSKKD